MQWSRFKPVGLIFSGVIGLLILGWAWSALPWPAGLFVPTWTPSYHLYQQPHAIWLSRDEAVGANLPLLTRTLKAAAKVKQVPEFVIYSIPLRDLGQSSEGGFANYDDYLADNQLNAKLIAQFVTATNLHPIIYLEPDSIPLAVQYRHDRGHDVESQTIYQDRVRMMKALIGLYEGVGARTYLEAGHSDWFDYGNENIERIANALNDMGIQQASGLSSNVSNRQPVTGLDPNARNELHYLKRLLPYLKNKHLDVRVDTSRNGGSTKSRQYALLPDGRIADNEISSGRFVGSWQAIEPGNDIRLQPLYGKPKFLKRLVAKEKYTWNPQTRILIAPSWLDAVGDVKLGPAPTDNPPANVKTTIQHYRYIKPPDDCDGALNCPPGASKHTINEQTEKQQPTQLPRIQWQQ